MKHESSCLYLSSRRGSTTNIYDIRYGRILHQANILPSKCLEPSQMVYSQIPPLVTDMHSGLPISSWLFSISSILNACSSTFSCGCTIAFSVSSSGNCICHVQKPTHSRDKFLGDRALHRIVIQCYNMLLYNSNVMHELRNVPFYLHIARFRGLIVPQNFTYVVYFASVADVYLYLYYSLELIHEFV